MAKVKQQIIIGINHEIFDEETDVSTSFHVIRHISFDFSTNYHIATLDSYARQRTYERGGRAVGSVQVNLTGKPLRGADLLDWVYQAITAPVADGATDQYGQPLTGNLFSGSDLVYSDLPGAEEAVA